jgi:hypothetical protein
MGAGIASFFRDLGLNILGGRLPLVIGIVLLVATLAIAVCQNARFKRFSARQRRTRVGEIIYYCAVFVVGGGVIVALVFISERLGLSNTPPNKQEIISAQPRSNTSPTCRDYSQGGRL